MRHFAFMLLFFIPGNLVFSQLYIGANAVFSLSGNAELSLSNANLVNNGSFTAGNSSVHFLGNAGSGISGTQPTEFYNLVVNKSSGISVSLQRHIGVENTISFTAGLLELNNFNIDLGTTGSLVNENETSRITGTSGGQVLLSTTLNAPSSVNPGNLGAVITSAQNLGTVNIKRGHQSQVNGFGTGSSIHRYFDIDPVNNTSLNATLRFNYFDAELNGIAENSLELWKSADNLVWHIEGFTNRNSTSNFVEKNNINDFSRWTLSSLTNPLPLKFVSFTLACDPEKVLLTWKTAQEQNTHYFDIERSTDGTNWTAIGRLPAAGNSSGELMYSFEDNLIIPGALYRIVEFDIDGQKNMSGILHSACSSMEILAYPNPTNNYFNVKINSTNRNERIIMQVLDIYGRILETRNVVANSVTRLGANYLPGTYFVKVMQGDEAAYMLKLIKK